MVVSCVVFTYEARYIPAVITLVRAPSAAPAPVALAAPSALPHRSLYLSAASTAAPSPAVQPLLPSPSVAAAAPSRWLLSDAPPPAWISAWQGEGSSRSSGNDSGASSGATPRALQAGAPDITTISVLVETFGMSRWLFIALALGFMIGALVFSVGSISGANINPAVTLALAVSGKLSWFRALCYSTAQCLGSVLGALVVRSLAPALFLAAGGGANGVVRNPSVSLWTVLGGEILGTAILVLTVCAAADVGREQSSKYQGALTPLMIGLAVAAAHLFLLPVDGCSLNPARSFGPAMAMGQFPDHWVFWAGPCIGGVLASLVYTNIFVGFELACIGGGRGPWEEGGGGGGSSAGSGAGSSGRWGSKFSEGEGGSSSSSSSSSSSAAGKGAGGAGMGELASPTPSEMGGLPGSAGEEHFTLEDEDSVGSAGSSSLVPTPLFGAVGGAAGAAGSVPAIDSRLSVLQAQGRVGAVAVARGEEEGLVRRMSSVTAHSLGGGVQERPGVREW